MDMSILEAQSDVLFGNVAGWEQSVLNRIAKQINAVGKMSVADVKALNNIAFVKQDMKEITKDLARMTGMNVSQIEKIYGDTLAQQHLENSPLYDYRNKKFVPFADNKELQAIVRAYSKTTAVNMVNLSKIGANNLGVLDVNGKFKPLERFYTDALDKAVMQVASGSTDFHTAMRDVIRAMGGSGIRVSYPGTDITRRLDTAVRQSLLWGAKQASVEYNEMIGEELGCDGIEIDWHSNPRPSHEFMQGKQYVLGKSRIIKGKYYESADKALNALNDYGCLHYKTPIICGISEPRYNKQELAKLNKQNAQKYVIDGKEYTGYEAKQMMRKFETAVREQKTIRDAARVGGDSVLVNDCTAKIKAYQKKHNEIRDITGMSPQPKRMSVPKGLNSVKSVDFSGNSGIIYGENEDSPRKSKKGEYSVNWGKIQTPEYKKRLSSVVDNKNALSSVETRAKWLLNNRDGKDTEELYAVKLSNGEEVGRITDQHLRKRVNRTPEFQAKLDSADDMGEAVILMHNHPDGLPPSNDDINALMTNKNVSGLTVGYDGSLYYYTRPEKPILRSDFVCAVNNYKEFSETTSFEKALEELQKEFGFTFKKL